MSRTAKSLLAIALLGGVLLAQPLTIYTEISPPDQFLGPDGKLTGYAYELVREIQVRAGNADPIEVVPWIRAYKALQEKPNVLLFTVARSQARDHLFQWVGPLRDTSFDFYVRKDSPITIRTVDDARKLGSIGVYKEDIRDQYLTSLGFTNLDRSIDGTIALRKLMSGRIDCYVSFDKGAEEIALLAGFQPDDIRKAGSLFHMPLYLAFSKGTGAVLVKSWAAAYESMRKDGTFERIFHKYFPRSPLPPMEAGPF